MRTLTTIPLFSLALTLALTGCPPTTPADDDDSAGDDDDDATGDDDDDASGITECDGNVCIVSGTITEDQTWSADYQWLLRGGVFIGDDQNPTTLTIEPGTTIYGESSTDGMLVVRRHSQLMAEGTADAPIVFTSSNLEGDRARGDWGGIIINGLAPINSCDGEADPCEAFGEGGAGYYGGSDPDDDSGILRYVRVEFAGTLLSPDNELNGIAFQGVGRGTTLDHIQVHMNADDGIEFFGGTAEIRNVLLSGIGDDAIDWTDGWQGKLQYGVVLQFDDNGDNGIEADNNGESNDAAPRSAPTLSHVTLIGSGGSNSDIGVLLREGTAGNLSNFVITNWGDACLDIDNDATFLNAWDETTGALNGNLTLTHSVLDCDTNYDMGDGDDAFSVEAFGNTYNEGNDIGSAGIDYPASSSTPNFVPAAGSLPTTGGVAPADSFFDDVTFRGGVDPENDWTVGWTNFARN